MPSRKDQLEEVLREVIAPLLRADSGELYVVFVDEEEVCLHLAGRFAGCPGNTLVVRQIIRPALERVAPGVRVSVTWGALVPKHAVAVLPDRSESENADP